MSVVPSREGLQHSRNHKAHADHAVKGSVGLLSTWWRVLISEMWKGLLIRWSYRFNFITEMLTFAFIFVGVSFFIGEGSLEPDRLASTLIGYVLWFYALTAISNMSWNLREEANVGTLEQMYMSPAPSALIQLGRTLTTLVTTTLMVAVMVALLVPLLGIVLPLRWSALPIFLLTMMGLYGFGFLIGGATLLFKQVEALSNLLQNALLFLNGSFLPVDQLPRWLERIALLLPTTEGIILLRRVLLDGESLRSTWIDGSLLNLTIHSVFFLVGGLIVFGLCERVAKKRGLLGQY